MNQNPYKVLNLQDDSSYEEIKERYLHLSKNLHPDKQPLQNYTMAKQHFEEIDKAYKSICSPLRRFIFREYGLPGISLIDQYPQQFYQFQNHRHQDQVLHVDLNNPSVQKKIRQLIQYMIHQSHAMKEIDKSKLNTRTVINVTKLLKQNKFFQDSIKAPDLQKNGFSYQMPLPDFYGFSNSFGLSHQSSGFARSASTQLSFNFNSMMRFRNTFLLHGQLQINKNQSNFDFNIDKIIGTSFQLRFNPISINTLGQIGIPKLGFDKSFQKYSVSGITDFYHVNFQIAENQKEARLSKSTKIMIQKNAIMLVPKIQYDLTESLKFICQTMITLNRQQNFPNLGLGYGYKLKINQELKIELMSFFGSQNYLQVTFFSPKFKVTLPIVSQGAPLKLQLYKVGVMLSTYFLFQLYGYVMRNKAGTKKKTLQKHYDRLLQEKQSLNRLINQANVKAKESFQNELKYNGLIIIKSFIGCKRKINILANMFKKLRSQNGTNKDLFQKIDQEIKDKINLSNISFNQIQDELYEITQVIQENVIGAQLINQKLQNIKICVYENQKPYITILYLLRGKIGVYHQQATKAVNIGNLNKVNLTLIRKLQLWAKKLW